MCHLMVKETLGSMEMTYHRFKSMPLLITVMCINTKVRSSDTWKTYKLI